MHESLPVGVSGILDHPQDCADLQRAVKLLEAPTITARMANFVGAPLEFAVRPAWPETVATMPLALEAAVRDGRIRRGQKVLLEGVGGGFTWGAVLLEF